MSFVSVRSSYLCGAAALGLACLLIPAPAAAQTPYRDPQGRYTMKVPPGWNVTQLNSDAVQFASGAAYVTMLSFPGAEPRMMLDSIAGATGKQWKNFAEARRGDARFGGRSAQYATYSGSNPKGMDSYLQMLAVTDGATTFLMMTSASKADFTRMKGAFDQIEQSFTLAPPARVSDAPPPAPAGALSAAAPARTPAAAAPSARQSSAAQPGVFRMKRVRIVDERGFERPMTALSMLIPIDWQFQGAVQYGQAAGCHANLVKLVFRATSADGRLSIELFPGNTWQWTDDPNMRGMLQASNQQMAQWGRRGCDVMAPMSADDFLRRVVLPYLRRDARIVGSEPMPDAVRQLQDEASVMQQVAARQGVRVNIRSDAGRIRLTGTRGGQPVEEWFTAMTSSIAAPGPTFDMRSGRMGQALYYSNTADHVLALSAPPGQLDSQDKLFQLVMSTITVDPQWQARVQQVIANLQAQDSKGASDRSAIITQAGHDMSRMIHDAYQNSTRSREHSMEGWSQYMRGVQTFRNPNTGETVELSNQYAHGWAGADGTYLLTDNGSFNPNSTLQGNWTRLESVPR